MGNNISLENWLRNKLQENEEMHDYAVSTETIRCWIGEYNSHSPTIEQHDTLQEGDWFQGTEEDYRKVLEIGFPISKYAGGSNFPYGMVFLLGTLLRLDQNYKGKTKLAPEEFLRRADNTFKTKWDEGN